MERCACGQCGGDNRRLARYCGHCGVLLVRPLPASLTPLATPPAPLRSGDVIGDSGRYRIDQYLGGGRFSQVFLAEDTHLNRLCAIKQLRIDPDWPPETVRQVMDSFAHESRLLASLTSPGHRNIPEIYDHLDAQLCLVMKHIAGEDLSALMTRRAAPLPEDEALRYARDACAALAYMHARRPAVLHRDLKPANMIRDTSGSIVLIDFGLASPASSGDPLALAQAGTPGYMPPEQWRGVPVPRSDVYALGATLYRMLTCRTPPSPEVEPPPPIRQMNPAVRPEVEALVRRTLASAPIDRPSAADLLAELEDLLTRRDVPPPEPEHPPSPPDLVGRTAELDELVVRLADDRAVALAGMPGAGKTALAATLTTRYPDQSRVFWHTFRAGEGVDVLIWRLAGWLACAGRPDVWQRIQGARQSGGPPLSPDLLVSYVTQLMRGWDGLLCLDDLHLAADDPVLLRVIGLLSDAARAGGPALLATARAVPDAARIAVTITIGGLPEDAARTLLDRAGLGLSMEQVAELVRATEGNPQFLTLAIAALRRGTRPEQMLGRLTTTGDLGTYLLHEVDAGLSAQERKAMEAIAVLLGYGGTPDVVTALTGGRSVWRTLTRLVERHLLSVEPRADGDVYRQHAIVQGFYYATLAQRRRKVMHERTGVYYETEGQDLLAAARHFAQASLPERVAAALTRDIWRLINAGQSREVRALLEAVPVAGIEPELRADVRTALGEICAILGEYESARSLLELTLSESPRQDIRQARRHRLLAQVCARTGDYDQAEASCRRGLALADTAGPVRTETARIYSQLADVLMRHSAFDEAEVACRNGLAVLPRAPANPGERGALLLRQATVAGRRGAYAAAISDLEQSLVLARQVADPILTSAGLHNLGIYHHLSGRIEQALACYSESLHLAEQVGDLARQLATINTLGGIHLDRGEIGEAMRRFEECRTLSEQFNLLDELAFALLNIGTLRYEQGELDTAAGRLDHARQIFSQIGVRDEEAHCLYVLGDIALRQGDSATAKGYGQQALDLANQIGSQVFASCALRVRGEACLALGDLSSAADDLAESWRLQQDIGDPYDEALIRAASARLAYAEHDQTRARTEARAILPFARERGMAYLEHEMVNLLANLDKP